MRPRVFPAEDVIDVACVERPAIHASMRPRVFPAEDAKRREMTDTRYDRFNEAAGIPRGRHGMQPEWSTARYWLQ